MLLQSEGRAHVALNWTIYQIAGPGFIYETISYSRGTKLLKNVELKFPMAV